MYITPMLNLKPNKLQFCCIINTTVDWELFAVLIFSMLNFCALYFGHPPTGVGSNSNFYNTFNFHHLGNRRKIVNGENFLIYGITPFIGTSKYT